MDNIISIIILGGALTVSIASLFIAIRALRIQRIVNLKGPELYAYFEQDRRGSGSLLVIENVGDATLEMDVSIYVDPIKDDRYPKNETTPIWIFRRKLYPGRPKRWMHPFQVVLSQMGYRQDCTYIVRLVGKFWPAVSGIEFNRKYFQEYKAILISDRWLYVEQSDTDWYYADVHPKINLARKGIPEALRKENESDNR